MIEKIKKHIACCVPCILVNRKRGKIEGYLNPIPKGEIPLETYHVDHVGPMDLTTKLYKYLFVVIDAFTKFIRLYPTKTTCVKEVIEKLKLQQITFGNPVRIITDRGAAFTSNDFAEYCKAEKILHLTTTTGVPRGNGQVERVHQVVISVLSKLSMADPSQWYKYVGRVQRCINSTYQRTIGRSPFELLTGIKMVQTEDVFIHEMIELEVANIYNDAHGMI